MNHPSNPNLNSGQQTLIRRQFASSGIARPRLEQQQRPTQLSEYSTNSSNSTSQFSSRVLNTGIQNTSIQKSASVS